MKWMCTLFIIGLATLLALMVVNLLYPGSKHNNQNDAKVNGVGLPK